MADSKPNWLKRIWRGKKGKCWHCKWRKAAKYVSYTTIEDRGEPGCVEPANTTGKIFYDKVVSIEIKKRLDELNPDNNCENWVRK